MRTSLWLIVRGHKWEAFIPLECSVPGKRSQLKRKAFASGQRCCALALMLNPPRECVSFRAVHLAISPLSILTRLKISVECEFDQRERRTSLSAAWPHIRVRSYAKMAEVNSLDDVEDGDGRLYFSHPFARVSRSAAQSL